jgi:mannose-6-phosphate isomerase
VWEPIRLPSNRPANRFYRGGERIATFRGEPSQGPRTPEDWVGSTTSVRDADPVGLTTLPDGRLLLAEVEREPESWLGADHLAAFGVDTKLLVKLLDAGQRLPIHAHPSVAFASAHLGSSHGKAEAWYVLESGEVYLGLREDHAHDEVLDLVQRQATDDLLAAMHRVPVQADETVYVPPGLLHAIGEGILLVEVQEPEDLSILLEWRGFELDGGADGHLGIGFDTALQAVETRARSPLEIASLVGSGTSDGEVLAAGSERFFRLERLSAVAGPECPPSFAIVVVIDGAVDLSTGSGARISAERGSTMLVPHAAGALRFASDGTVVVARPPVSR